MKLCWFFPSFYIVLLKVNWHSNLTYRNNLRTWPWNCVVCHFSNFSNWILHYSCTAIRESFADKNNVPPWPMPSRRAHKITSVKRLRKMLSSTKAENAAIFKKKISGLVSKGNSCLAWHVMKWTGQSMLSLLHVSDLSWWADITAEADYPNYGTPKHLFSIAHRLGAMGRIMFQRSPDNYNKVLSSVLIK